jgi:hypothetical protein
MQSSKEDGGCEQKSHHRANCMNKHAVLQYLPVAFLAAAIAGGAKVGAQPPGEPDVPAAMERVSAAADKLIASGDELARAAARMSRLQSCVVDRELVGLGGALNGASGALKLIEPMLLKKKGYSLFNALQGKQGDVDAVQKNMRRVLMYRATLDSVAKAGQGLAALDPAGAAGPSTGDVQLLIRAGQSLLDLDVDVGLHVRRIGEAMETIRIATARYDKPMCPDAALLMGQMVGLAGESLSVYAGVLHQADALQMIGLALFVMSQGVPNPSVESLKSALNDYQMSLKAEAGSLAESSVIADAVKLPPAAAAAVSAIRDMASRYGQGAASLRSIAARVDEALQAMAGNRESKASAHPLGAVMQSVGKALMQVPDLLETGDSLVRAGVLLSAGEIQAADVLRTAGLKLASGKVPVLQQE